MVITNPKAAKLLTRAEVLAHLTPFMKEPRSLKEAATELALPIPNVHYWASKFLSLGLLEVVRVEQRVGKPVKYYRASAQRYVVPGALVPEGHFEHSERAWVGRFWSALERASPEILHRHGVEVGLEADGSLSINPYPDPPQPWDLLGDEAPAALNTWSDALHLDPSDAKALQRELWGLFDRYRRKAGRHPYIVHLGLAPA